MEEDLNVLLARYLDGESSEAELQRLYDHFGHPEGDDKLAEAIRAYLLHHDEGYRGHSTLANEIADNAYARVMKATKPARRLRWLRYAAAAILLVVGWLVMDDRWSATGNHDLVITEEILPGRNRAILTLADGRTISLDEAQTGIIVGEGITYTDGTGLTSGDSTLAGGVNLKSDTVNELVLSTPKGGTYQITLSDGSRVWLNAASTLRYPSRFSGDSREVVLEGEAYFDISERANVTSTSSKKIPFRVISKGQTIEVLGTEFNISAYVDEAEITTTLVEGKIKVTPGSQKGTSGLRSSDYVLAPGQQASTRGTAIEIRDVDPAPYTAWRSGKFSFDGKPFVQIMNEVSRWYDLEVVYEGAKPTEQLIGDAFRSQNISIVLGMLDVLEINYKLDISVRKLTIYEKKGGNR